MSSSPQTHPFDFDETTTFTRETELAGPVRAWLTSLPNVSIVVDEIDSGFGVADLVAARGPSESLTTRLADVAPITNSVQMQLILEIQQKRTISQLRAWAPHGWSALRARALEPLVEAGVVKVFREDDEIAYKSAVSFLDPFQSLIAVELKLNDWRRGALQTGRYRLFAEQAYLAMPLKRIKHELIKFAQLNSVGLLAVSPGGVEVIEPSAASTAIQSTRRRRASELMLAALADKNHPSAGSTRGAKPNPLRQISIPTRTQPNLYDYSAQAAEHEYAQPR